MTRAPILDLNNSADKVLDIIRYWKPPVQGSDPIKKPNSSLVIAAIVSDRLYHGLRYEGNLLLLTPNNWKNVLRYGSPDFLLVESTWFTATGHWYMAQSVPGQARGEFEELISFAHKSNIPTVFWFTLDTAYHEHFKEFASNFDHVYCADPFEIAKIQKEGMDAETLLPAVQPAIHNPLRLFGQHNAFEISILYDGWTDILRHSSELKVLRNVVQHELRIIESRHSLTKPQLKRSPDYLQNSILGCVTAQDLPTILKYTGLYITLTPTIDTPIHQAWSTLETAACRVPILHRGSFPGDDLRKNYISAQPQDSDFLLELLRFENDSLYRERIAQKAWRYAFLNNTFSHRIRKICRKLSINHNWNEFPKATIITPTIRPRLLDRCVKQYDLQTYPNKELIIVFNGPNQHVKSYVDFFKNRSDIKLLTIPKEYFAGTSLNMGINYSKGEVCFRMDDDDHYGKNYILDAMLYLKAVDAELIGKTFAYMHLENKGIYRRPKKQLPPSIFLGKDLDYSKVPLAGCSIAGKRNFFTKVKYPDKNAFAADAILSKKIYSNWRNLIGVVLDQMNMVVERKEDISKHTWQIDNQVIISSSNFTPYDIEDLMV
jgi:hypothetical protein